MESIADLMKVTTSIHSILWIFVSIISIFLSIISILLIFKTITGIKLERIEMYTRIDWTFWNRDYLFVRIIYGLLTLCWRLLRLPIDEYLRYEPVRYKNIVLSPLLERRLELIGHRKILVLDLDETLVHAINLTTQAQERHPYETLHSFEVNLRVETFDVKLFVRKRPHVDFFLATVAQWYELVIFTASLEYYGSAVADYLDDGRNILKRRYFRQHCTFENSNYNKNLANICDDMKRVLIIDNSPGAYRKFPYNALPIKSWYDNAADTCLLDLLPLLDALRFMNDVRTILARRNFMDQQM